MSHERIPSNPPKKHRVCQAGGGGITAVSVISVQRTVQAVTGLSWAGRHHLYSSSLDHSLKRWDVDAGVAVDTMATGKALLCCAAGCEEAGRAAVVVGGGADGTLRWWDCRSASRSTEALVRTPTPPSPCMLSPRPTRVDACGRSAPASAAVGRWRCLYIDVG